MESEYTYNKDYRYLLTCIREIVDESDVYVDVHKAIRRLTPAPRARRIEAAAAAAAAKKTTEHPVLVDIAEDSEGNTLQVGSLGAMSDSGATDGRPRTAIFMRRRGSADGHGDGQPEAIKASLDEMRTHLRLGPANRAAKPRDMKNENVFKIKQGLASTQASTSGTSSRMPPRSATEGVIPKLYAHHEHSERTPLLGRHSEMDTSKANGSYNHDDL